MRFAILLIAALPLGAVDAVLTFDKISKFDRPAEPVSFGMPFPKGVLRDPLRFRLLDGSRALPVQAKVTGRWADSSVRWLFVRTLVDLPGNSSKQIRWELSEGATPAPLPVRRLADGALQVDTGPLVATISAAGFLPFSDVRLNGQPLNKLMRGFTIAAGNQAFSTADAGPVKTEVLEQGPVAVVIGVSGRHGGAHSPFDFSARLTFTQGKPYVALEYRVLAARGQAETLVSAWEWLARPVAQRARLRVGHGHYATRILESDTRASYSFGEKDFLYDSVEHAFQSYWGDFWGDWSGTAGGLALTLRHAQQNFPKAIEVTPDSLRLSLYPAGPQPLRFPLGAAKTHCLLFHFHAPEAPVQELSRRSLQFQIPDVAKLDSAWYAKSQVWDEQVFEGPRSRRFEALVYDILDNRPVGLGLWNFGDEVEWGYTGQGRGRGEVVWLNNEYDLAHGLFVQYARSGERRFLDYAAANALHWRDVDIAHVSPDPARQGGHIAHSTRHVTGGVGPSHQWVEGLFDACHMLGDDAACQAALGIGDNILRAMASPAYRRAGQTSTRDMGWALRAMLALHRETGEQKYADASRKIAALFRDWHAQYPGLLAPYTDHSLVRVNFMNALTLVSLARYLRYFPNPEIRRLVLEETGDMLRNGRNANGLFYYKELPSLEHQTSSLLPLQLLAHAYELSGDKRYLQAGLTELEYALTNMNMRFMVHTGAAEKFVVAGEGYSRVLVYPQGGKFVGIGLLPVLEFLHAAKDTSLPRQIDFQLRLE